MSEKKKLEPNDIELILGWIDEQTSKVKFPAIKEACPSIIGKEFSIVALRKRAIVERVTAKNDRIRLGEITSIDELPSKRDIERNLRARVRVLEAHNANLRGYILTMTLNARRLGYSFDELERKTKVSTKITREAHERHAKEIEDKTRSRIEKQREHERSLDAAQADRKKRRRLAKRGKRRGDEENDE
ncbi:hypothetical protein QA649_37475 [Bradyrhizobium sp. CB1717]|uniref:hypothetical protein n=1 Tax=Bradyrhizobium sp. CB1717 TaxID=3039154 RepID=UPI0024B22E8F|nr:hypothetical protein [Bradyrhizobium sp. CB1717]WFU23644.1 hypothetical protein QA649_37475 [Bradyrhizobium sp. CB1717]